MLKGIKDECQQGKGKKLELSKNKKIQKDEVSMWEKLPEKQKQEYKRMILAFASLTEMFAQKAENEGKEVLISPIINSKYQETVFQRVFHATAEDIGNTSYDASLTICENEKKEIKYLIGIKTFGISSGAQKIAQFKANYNEWSSLINQMRRNARNADGSEKDRDEINSCNETIYLELAKKVSRLRNARIRSSESNIHGFSVNRARDDIHAVYHVLMPSKKGDSPVIYVGETPYNEIDVDNISIKGCTGKGNPTNFEFSDGKHTYRYTAADSQLLMNFDNLNIVKDKWKVVYADDAYALFSNLADQIYGENTPKIAESYSWMITNEDGEVEKFSGFNSFFGVGSKLSSRQREKRINSTIERFKHYLSNDQQEILKEHLNNFLLGKASSKGEKEKKVILREKIIEEVRATKNEDIIREIKKLVFRPKNELYIPIPNAKTFHIKHPNFFAPGVGTFKKGTNKLQLPKERCQFNLIFEPSGDCIRSFITQDNGKAIESYEKQSVLGEWILGGVFQLQEYEPLTAMRLNEIGINGVRLYKLEGSNDVHLKFIWIDSERVPPDYVG